MYHIDNKTELSEPLAELLIEIRGQNYGED